MEISASDLASGYLNNKNELMTLIVVNDPKNLFRPRQNVWRVISKDGSIDPIAGFEAKTKSELMLKLAIGGYLA